MITVKNVTKSFGRTRALNDLSFSVAAGEVVGFLGPNGAGKTTMMRILTGFLAADRGTVVVGNVDIEKDPLAAQQKIGYLPESNPLYKDMQVGEFLDLAARLHHLSEHKRREALDFVVPAVGIGNVFYKPIGELSKGYRQRVGIAAALIHRPAIIILDEPTEGLDPNQRAEIRTLIKALAKERTIIMSTHVMQEASAVCSRLLIISKGRLVADGTSAELSSRSRDKKVILLEAEGRNVAELLRTLPAVRDVAEKHSVAGRPIFEITVAEGSEIRPDISRLAWGERWVIWKLDEEEYRLEEIFQALTKD